MRAFLLVQFDLAGNHITELLSVLLLASEIGNHVPEILIEVAGPFFVAVTSIDLSERFLEVRESALHPHGGCIATERQAAAGYNPVFPYPFFFK